MAKRKMPILKAKMTIANMELNKLFGTTFDTMSWDKRKDNENVVYLEAEVHGLASELASLKQQITKLATIDDNAMDPVACSDNDYFDSMLADGIDPEEPPQLSDSCNSSEFELVDEWTDDKDDGLEIETTLLW